MDQKGREGVARDQIRREPSGSERSAVAQTPLPAISIASPARLSVQVKEEDEDSEYRCVWIGLPCAHARNADMLLADRLIRRLGPRMRALRRLTAGPNGAAMFDCVDEGAAGPSP